MAAQDPFSGGSKTPSLSWKDLPVGTVFVLDILEPAKLLQSRDFDSGQPAFWDSPTNTQPKMSAVVNVSVLQGPHSVGEERSIWAAKPSSMFSAIAEAQKQAGNVLECGGQLSIRFAGERAHENKRFNPIKLYEARYIPPVANAFTASPAPPIPQPPAPPASPPGMTGWAGTVTPPAAGIRW